MVWSNGHASEEPPFRHATFDFPLGCTVLDISIPHLPPAVGLYRSISTPQIFKEHVVVAVACSDFAVRVLKLPLNSASPSGEILASISQNSVPTSVALSWTSGNGSDDEMDTGQEDIDHGHLIVASCSRESLGNLHFACISISQGRAKLFQTLKLSEVPLKIEFNPSSHTSNHHSKILIACSAGLVYVYDPFSHPNGDGEDTFPSKGTWVALYSTKFATDEDELSSVSAQRKRILDASWASNGRSIVVLLEDGEWGVWSMPSRSDNSVSYASGFALWGVVGSGIPSHLAQGLEEVAGPQLPSHHDSQYPPRQGNQPVRGPYDHSNWCSERRLISQPLFSCHRPTTPKTRSFYSTTIPSVTSTRFRATGHERRGARQRSKCTRLGVPFSALGSPGLKA